MIPQRQTLTLVIVLLILLVFILSFRNQLQNVVEVSFKDSWSHNNKQSGDLIGDTCIETGPSKGHDDLVSLRHNGHSCGLAGVNLDNLDDYRLSVTLHSILDNVDTLCSRKIRVGNLKKGGWEVCDDTEVRPRPDCIVYSFTTGEDFSFDDGMANIYGCHVYSFNPTVDKKSRNDTAKKHFYNFGIGEKNKEHPKWEMRAMFDIRAMLGHKNSQTDVFLLDAEGLEWEVLSEMASTGALSNVHQLLIGFNTGDTTNRSSYLPKLKILQQIERLGFRKCYSNKQIKCPQKIEHFPAIRTKCYEVHYVLLD